MYDEIQKQLEVLNSKIRFFGKAKIIKNHIEALGQIGKFGTPYDAKYVTPYVFAENKFIAQKAATVIRQLLTKREIRTSWLNLYGSFSSYYSSDLFSMQSFKKLEHFTQEEAAHLYGIASLNYNGYVREEALNYLGKLSSVETLPYILLRLNDWVLQVRSKAREVLLNNLPSISVTNLIKYYNLIEWLEKTKRVELTDVQEKIFAQIRNPKNREELFTVMQKVTFNERLFCWKALAEEVTNDDSLIEKAIADPVPEIRQWAACHLPDTTSLTNRLNILLSDSAIRVRYAALKVIPQDHFEEYKELFDAAIFDDSKPIREYARFMLHSHGDNSHVDKYRKKLSQLQAKGNSGSVAGLAETGTKKDITLIKRFVDHKNPKIRASALSGLNRLGAEGTDNLYILGLQDNNTKVRNACVAILQSGYDHLRAELENLLENGNLKTQKSTLKILVHYGALSSLQDILFALTQHNEELRNAAWQHLLSWHNQYAIKLWFSFGDDTYERTVKMLDKLRKTNIEPPYYARNAWNDLPNIMKTIKK